jgi:hypothetical protein
MKVVIGLQATQAMVEMGMVEMEVAAAVVVATKYLCRDAACCVSTGYQFLNTFL